MAAGVDLQRATSGDIRPAIDTRVGCIRVRQSPPVRWSLKAGSLDRNCRQDHLLSPNLPLGVCNRWAKNATIGIDRGTADWLRDDARLAAPNTYGFLWDAANRGNRLVDARRTVVIANGASRQRRRGRNGSARCGARNSGTVSIRMARTSSQSPLPKTLTSARC
jgi:hypothetical protein